LPPVLFPISSAHSLARIVFFEGPEKDGIIQLFCGKEKQKTNPMIKTR
jgi:hypothetical protein